MAESLLDIQPAVDGRIEWLDSRTLTFSPSRPFELDSRLQADSQPRHFDRRRRGIEKRTVVADESPRPAGGVPDDGRRSKRVWAMGLNGEPAQRLTPEERESHLV